LHKGLTNSMDFTQKKKVCSVGILKFWIYLYYCRVDDYIVITLPLFNEDFFLFSNMINVTKTCV